MRSYLKLTGIVLALVYLPAPVRSFGVVHGARARVSINRNHIVQAPHPLTRTRRSSLVEATQFYAVPKKHHHDNDRNKLEKFLSFITSPIRRPLAYLGRCFFRFAVYHVSQFTTALLIDPGVNHAIANGIKDGMNLWCTQPNVKDKLVKLQQHLAESGGPSLAKQTGEGFPKVLVNFVVGLLLQGLDEPNHNSEQKHLTR